MERSCFKSRFCSKAGFNKGCHSQFCRAQHLGIFRILSSYAKKEKSLCDNDRYVEDPRLQASGMTPNWITPHGFTLIELLVVVLIIGILAAVAVPQYQKAVVRSRLAVLKAIVDPVARAQEVYYLAHGQYSSSFSELDVGMPLPVSDEAGVYTYDWGTCGLAVEYHQYFVRCIDKDAHIGYFYYLQGTTAYPKGPACSARDNSPIALKVCQQETGTTVPFYTHTNEGTNSFSYSGKSKP